MEDIISEAEFSQEKGKGSYPCGSGCYCLRKRSLRAEKLVELVREVSGIEGIEWIRLLYTYPEEIDEELIKEIANNEKVVKYLDIPIQHASDKILKLMGRRSTSEGIRNILDRLRAEVPDIVLRTR